VKLNSSQHIFTNIESCSASRLQPINNSAVTNMPYDLCRAALPLRQDRRDKDICRAMMAEVSDAIDSGQHNFMNIESCSAYHHPPFHDSVSNLPDDWFRAT
jgi:hypothetical protein